MPRVLIIDDQPSFRRQLRKLLTHAGMTVVGEAGDIPAAEKLIAELQPDIAVVDVMLPGISGMEGTPQLKALAENLRIYLVSAYHDSANVFQTSAQEVGAEAFVPKDCLDLELVKTWLQSNHAIGKKECTDEKTTV